MSAWKTDTEILKGVSNILDDLSYQISDIGLNVKSTSGLSDIAFAGWDTMRQNIITLGEEVSKESKSIKSMSEILIKVVEIYEKADSTIVSQANMPTSNRGHTATTLKIPASFLQTDTKKTVTVTGALKSDFKNEGKKFYDDYVDKSRKIEENNQIYSTHGSKTDGVIWGDIKYTKINDVKTFYYNREQGNNVDNVSGSGTITGQEIRIYEGTQSTTEGINIKLNTVDMHASSNWDIQKGNVYVSGGTEYDMASVGFNLGDSKNGIGTASAHVKVGAGASGTVGIHDGVLTVNGSVALGIGADVSFDINYKNAWNAICDTFHMKR